MTLSIGGKNFLKSLQLFNYFVKLGIEYFILCPGSRSAPLALAAGELYKRGQIKLYSSIDERSAGFHALGISAASNKFVIVITTSGTAVANLLPSAIEADKSGYKIIFITADRPLRLKNCGANQTLNQEDFLIPACNVLLSLNVEGLHFTQNSEIRKLIKKIIKLNLSKRGPIHLNIPIEEPLNISFESKKAILKSFYEFDSSSNDLFFNDTKHKIKNKLFESAFDKIDFSKDGIIIIGPFRGSHDELLMFNDSLKFIQEITGWPIFADPISGVCISIDGVIDNWELILSNENFIIKCDQLLRLGPMTSSNVLEEFLRNFNGIQVLIKENDFRNLDPTKLSFEYEFGLNNFVRFLREQKSIKISHKKSLKAFTSNLIKEGHRINKILKKQFKLTEIVTECSIANVVPDLWPENYPIMLSASSPIRDWLTFSSNKTLSRRCFSFRGASGIDGTLSSALGIARITENPLLLVTGDLAFLYDINGFLIEQVKEVNLKILVIDNNGGNIFNRIYSENLDKGSMEKLFLMPRELNWNYLLEAHSIPSFNVTNHKTLKEAIVWSLSIDKFAIIRTKIDISFEINQRKTILNYINHI